MYSGGDMKIYSKENCATTIQMIIPLNGLRQDYADASDAE